MSPPPPIAISTPYTFWRSQQASKIHQCILMVKTRVSEQVSELASKQKLTFLISHRLTVRKV